VIAIGRGVDRLSITILRRDDDDPRNSLDLVFGTQELRSCTCFRVDFRQVLRVVLRRLAMHM
jgi:hypothetical protein